VDPQTGPSDGPVVSLRHRTSAARSIPPYVEGQIQGRLVQGSAGR
jgi:hypothetical protein